jgi:hypothetical protein
MQDETLTARIRAEYLEMPGLSLNAAQVERLCGIEHNLCQVVLQSLVEQKFLRLNADGQYARLSVGAPRRRPAVVAASTRTSAWKAAS